MDPKIRLVLPEDTELGTTPEINLEIPIYEYHKIHKILGGCFKRFEMKGGERSTDLRQDIENKLAKYCSKEWNAQITIRENTNDDRGWWFRSETVDQGYCDDFYEIVPGEYEPEEVFDEIYEELLRFLFSFWQESLSQDSANFDGEEYNGPVTHANDMAPLNVVEANPLQKPFWDTVDMPDEKRRA